ncbi:hypothetical protein IC582_000149 [Cucumis melo]|uniref:Uncharacterized protein n=1 Tax=Cucumis melo var. makuwa TaxID=1194695 RepID=A0A5D3C4P0_CUCMM|nr:uncharacterized protein E6C27_scaffold139G001310 [Cucumis melo var. makuwa]TYK06827.1 uncharacterized protein E5676_scaffold13G001310 [Cucumis melo var. makuwa]
MDHGRNLFVSSDGSVESGWTVYLENSSSYFSRRIDDHKDFYDDDDDDEDQEVDLSMVSDASSGPQIFPENNNNELVFPQNYDNPPPCYCAKTAGSLLKTGRKMKGGESDRRQQQTTSFLDDTATSDPNFNLNNSVQLFLLFFNFTFILCFLFKKLVITIV